MRTLLFIGSLLLTHSVLATDWDYKNQDWAEHEEAFAECKSGTQQSPINIDTKNLTKVNQIQFKKNYSVVNGTLTNTGKTLQINFQSGHFLTLDHSVYELIQLHFHIPSEHTINGVSYPLEMHLVHKNSESKLAVIGVLFKESEMNEQLNEALDHMAKGELDKSVTLDLSSFIPDEKGLFTYDGSLTTPPCTQGVKWFVSSELSSLSKQQLSQYRKSYENNSRHIQNLNNRNVFLIK